MSNKQDISNEYMLDNGKIYEIKSKKLMENEDIVKKMNELSNINKILNNLVSAKYGNAFPMEKIVSKVLNSKFIKKKIKKIQN